MGLNIYIYIYSIDNMRQANMVFICVLKIRFGVMTF